MNTNRHLQFIKDRIQDSEQAILYRYIDETHKQVIGIKKALAIDDSGQLYFQLSNTNFEQKYATDVFPVELFFYKKGNHFYMTAKGIAVKSATNIDKLPVNDSNVMRIRMDEIEYSELEGFYGSSLWAKCVKFIGQLNIAF